MVHVVPLFLFSFCVSLTPNIKCLYPARYRIGRGPLSFSSVRFIKPLLVQGPDDVNADDRDRKFFFRAAERPLDTHVSFTGRT